MDETVHADTFSYKPVKHEDAKPSAHEEKPAHEEEKNPEEKSSNLLLYIGIGLGNLLLIAALYFAYRFFIGGKAKDELAEFEKTLNAKPGEIKSSSAEKPQAKTEIDLSDEDPAHIPMNNEESLDKLFPLDSMEDPANSEDKK